MHFYITHEVDTLTHWNASSLGYDSYLKPAAYVHVLRIACPKD